MSVDCKTEGIEESKVVFMEKLISQLKCPICYETCLSPIYMCKNGHGVCAVCQAELKFCGVCRAPGKPTSRSLQLEGIAGLIAIPCKNQKTGCKRFFVSANEMANHLTNCSQDFVCYVCPEWKGSAQALNEHVKLKHAFAASTVPCNFPMQFWTSIPTEKSLHDHPHYSLVNVGSDVFWMEMLFTSATNVFSTVLRIVSWDELDATRYYYSVEFRFQELRMFQEARVKLINTSKGMKMDFILMPGVIDSLVDGKVWFTLKIGLNNPSFG